MSERNYSSYSSQEEPRPRSRSRSSRPSEPRRGRKPGKRGRGRTVLWVIGTLLLVAIVTGSIMCCFAAVYIRNTILPKSEMDLITRQVIRKREGENCPDEVLKEYTNPCSCRYAQMIEDLRREQNFTTLRYHRLDDLIEATGLPREKLCTYCWDGRE